MAGPKIIPDGRPDDVEIGRRVRITRVPSERLRRQGQPTIVYTGRVQDIHYDGDRLASVYLDWFGHGDGAYGWVGVYSLAANVRQVTVEVLDDKAE